MPSTTTLIHHNGFIIRRYTLIGGTREHIDVWERSGITGRHSTITTFDEGDGWWGDVTTRYLPDHLEAMKAGSEERIAAVHAYHANLGALAIQEARAAFPGEEADIVFEHEGSTYIIVLGQEVAIG